MSPSVAMTRRDGDKVIHQRRRRSFLATLAMSLDDPLLPSYEPGSLNLS